MPLILLLCASELKTAVFGKVDIQPTFARCIRSISAIGPKLPARGPLLARWPSLSGLPSLCEDKHPSIADNYGFNGNGSIVGAFFNLCFYTVLLAGITNFSHVTQAQTTSLTRAPGVAHYYSGMT